ncbi:MAG: hypothetical protein M1829_005022 [Trizodia sp. TS-e1964]|nr:MAG: hypothetical protein M1829_005022 [Trizodia sp. TS-e1964]
MDKETSLEGSLRTMKESKGRGRPHGVRIREESNTGDSDDKFLEARPINGLDDKPSTMLWILKTRGKVSMQEARGAITTPAYPNSAKAIRAIRPKLKAQARRHRLRSLPGGRIGARTSLQHGRFGASKRELKQQCLRKGSSRQNAEGQTSSAIWLAHQTIYSIGECLGRDGDIERGPSRGPASGARPGMEGHEPIKPSARRAARRSCGSVVFVHVRQHPLSGLCPRLGLLEGGGGGSSCPPSSDIEADFLLVGSPAKPLGGAADQQAM